MSTLVSTRTLGLAVIGIFILNLVLAVGQVTVIPSLLPFGVSSTPDWLNLVLKYISPYALSAINNSFTNPLYPPVLVNSSFHVINPGTVDKNGLDRALLDTFFGHIGDGTAGPTLSGFVHDYSPAAMATSVWNKYGGIITYTATDGTTQTYANYNDFYAAVTSSTDQASIIANKYGFGFQTGDQFVCACEYWTSQVLASAVHNGLESQMSSSQIIGAYEAEGYSTNTVINAIAKRGMWTSGTNINGPIDTTFYGNGYVRIVTPTVEPTYIIDGSGQTVGTPGSVNLQTGPAQIKPPYGGGDVGSFWQIVEQNGGIGALQGGGFRGVVFPEWVVRQVGAHYCDCDSTSATALSTGRERLASLSGPIGSVLNNGYLVTDSGACLAAEGSGHCAGIVSVSSWKTAFDTLTTLNPILQDWNTKNPDYIIQFGYSPYSSGVPGFTSISTPTVEDAAWNSLFYSSDPSTYATLSTCTGNCADAVYNSRNYLLNLWDVVQLNGWTYALPNAPGYPQPVTTGTNVPYPTLGCIGPVCTGGGLYTNYLMNGLYMELMHLVSNPPQWALDLGIQACTGRGCISLDTLDNWVDASIKTAEAVQNTNYDGLAGVLGGVAIFGTSNGPGYVAEWSKKASWSPSSPGASTCGPGGCGKPFASTTLSNMVGTWDESCQCAKGGYSLTDAQAWSWGVQTNGQPFSYGSNPLAGALSGGTYGAFATSDPLAMDILLSGLGRFWNVITSSTQNWLNYKNYAACVGAGLACSARVTPSGIFVVDPPTIVPKGEVGNLGPVIGHEQVVASRYGGTPVTNVYDNQGRPLGCIALLPLCVATNKDTGLPERNTDHVGTPGAGGRITLIPMIYQDPNGNLMGDYSSNSELPASPLGPLDVLGSSGDSLYALVSWGQINLFGITISGFWLILLVAAAFMVFFNRRVW